MNEPRDETRRRAAHAAADEIRRETQRAGAEIRLELAGVDEELRRSLREAMSEVRATLTRRPRRRVPPRVSRGPSARS
jgi:hypothetical protein